MDIVKTVLTSLLSVVSIFLITKIMGHKQMAQLDFFDYITGITIGSIAAELSIELETPLRCLTALIIYGIVSVLLSFTASKFTKARKYINGAPTILMNGGKLYHKNMKIAKLDLSEFMVMCREQGYFNLNSIETAVFEHNGKITILPTAENRPVTPQDLNLQPQKEYINVEVIMDGRIIEENLTLMGVDLKWLEKQIKSQGYKSAKDIFLGVCDKSKKVTLFEYQ